MAGESVKIGWYVTDWRHSLARFQDDSPRFNPKRFKGEIRPNCRYDEKCMFPDGWVSGKGK